MLDAVLFFILMFFCFLFSVEKRTEGNDIALLHI